MQTDTELIPPEALGTVGLVGSAIAPERLHAHRLPVDHQFGTAVIIRRIVNGQHIVALSASLYIPERQFAPATQVAHHLSARGVERIGLAPCDAFRKCVLPGLGLVGHGLHGHRQVVVGRQLDQETAAIHLGQAQGGSSRHTPLLESHLRAAPAVAVDIGCIALPLGQEVQRDTCRALPHCSPRQPPFLARATGDGGVLLHLGL